MGWRVEVWNLPSDSPHEVIIADLQPVNVKWSKGISVAGTGMFQLPSTYARLGEVVSPTNDVQSLVRCYWNEQMLFAFFPTSTSEPYADPAGSMIDISGDGVLSMLEWAIAYPYDYSAFPSKTADHIYGSDGSEGSFSNGGFEEPDFNGDAEAGDIKPWGPTPESGIFSAPTSAVVSSVSPIAGTYSFLVDPDGNHSGIQLSVDVIPGERIDFSGILNEATGSGDRHTMYVEMGKGSTMNVGAKVWSGYAVGELDAAAYLTGASNGFDQTLDVAVTFGAEVEKTTVTVMYDHHSGGGSELPFKVDSITITGAGVGLPPWEPNGFTDLFEQDPVTFRSGTQSLKWQVGSGSGLGGTSVLQKVTGLVIGKTYTWGAWFQHDGVGNEPIRLVSWRPDGDFISSDLTQIPTGAQFTYAYSTFTADTNEIWFDWRYDAAGASPVFNIDDANIAEGLAATTIGQIYIDMMDDATLDHVAETAPGAPRATLDFIKYDGFTALLDSEAISWNADVALVVPVGQSYLQMVAQTKALGYETTMHWTGTEWELRVYNPLGIGTDYSAAASPAITGGTHIVSGQIAQLVKHANRALGFGAEGVWAETAVDAPSETALSRREAFVGSLETLDFATVEASANEAISSFQATADGFKLTFAETATFIPGVDFVVGDIVNVDLPTHGIDNSYRVTNIAGNWNTVGESTFTVDFGTEVVLAGSSTSVAVGKMLSRFQPLRENTQTFALSDSGLVATPPFTGPIETTVLVASADASQAMKDVADYVCDGVDDDVEVQSAADQLDAAGFGGTIQLTEGEYVFTDGVELNNAFVGINLVGAGQGATVIKNLGNIVNSPNHYLFVEMTNVASVVSDITFHYTAANGASGWGLVESQHYGVVRDCNFILDGVSDNNSHTGVEMGGENSTTENCNFDIQLLNGQGVTAVFDNPTVRGCTFIGSANAVNSYAMWSGGGAGGIFEGNTVHDVFETGIVDAGDGLKVVGNSIFGGTNLKVGIDVTSGGHYSVLDSNHIICDAPIQIQAGWCVVSNNTIVGWGNSKPGIWVFTLNNVIDGNMLALGSGVGEAIYVSSGGDSNIISGNSINDAPNDGIKVDGSEVVISGNVIDGAVGHGIRVTGNKAAVTGNYVTDVTGTGIGILASGTHVLIDGNSIVTCGDSGISTSGINAVISNNILTDIGIGVANVAIYSQGVAALIDGNHISSCESTAAMILVASGEHTVVSNNHVADAPENAIEVASVDYCLVIGNTIDTPVGDGIVAGGADGSIIGNHIFGNFALSGTGILVTALNVLVQGNRVYGMAGNGIEVDSTGDGAFLDGNYITWTTGDGILIAALADNVMLGDNRIDDTTGTDLNDAASTTVFNNMEQESFTHGPVIAVTTGLYEVAFKYDIEILEIEARVAVAPTGSSVIVDVQKDGTANNLYTTQASRPTIATTTKTHTTTPDVTFVAAGSYLTVDVDQKDSNDVAVNLTVIVRYRRA